MSKGDFIEVTTLTGGKGRIEALRAGRRVEQKAREFNKVRWIDVKEVTRGGNPTGNTMSIRLDQVVSIWVATQDTTDAMATPVVRFRRKPAGRRTAAEIEGPWVDKLAVPAEA